MRKISLTEYTENHRNIFSDFLPCNSVTSVRTKSLLCNSVLSVRTKSLLCNSVTSVRNNSSVRKN